MKVRTILPVKKTGLTKQELYDYISECSSVVRDKQPKNAERLFGRLEKESIGDKPSRVLEYIPCTLDMMKFVEPVGFEPNQLFGSFENMSDNNNATYYTNARELMSWGLTLDDILPLVDFTHYEVFKCETPYFIYGQVSTHNQITSVSHSQRYSDCTRGYWKPPEVECSQEMWNDIVMSYSPLNLIKYMKDCGIVRKEVFDRGRDMLQNRVFTIGGYKNNPNAWEHFVKQRLDTHTQKETREFTELLGMEF